MTLIPSSQMIAFVLVGLTVLAAEALVVAPDLASVIARESSRPVQCVGVLNEADLAPESQVLRLELEAETPRGGELRNSGSELVVEPRQPSKQSQEFDIGNSSNLITLPPVVVPIVETTLAPSSPSTTSSPTVETIEASSTNSTTTTTTTTTSAPSTSSEVPGDEPPPFLPSNITRQGAKVFCGEANPNGQSNDRLVPSRIVGGQKTKPGEFPFQVRLNIRSRRGSGICGGVIIDERHILTAAHCMTACVSQHLNTVTIETTGVHATIGDHSIKSNDGETEVEIEKIIPHEKYDACNFYANDHDIALIKTATPMEYKFTTDGYGSVNRPCMPKPAAELTTDTYREGEAVFVSGWGVTRENSGSLSNILRYVQVFLVNLAKCQDVYGTRVTNDHICAGHQLGGKDSCQGDSGGPLVRLVDNRFELVGIVSFGYGCGQPGAPGVYTRVASYIDWIKTNL